MTYELLHFYFAYRRRHEAFACYAKIYEACRSVPIVLKCLRMPSPMFGCIFTRLTCDNMGLFVKIQFYGYMSGKVSLVYNENMSCNRSSIWINSLHFFLAPMGSVSMPISDRIRKVWFDCHQFVCLCTKLNTPA